MFIGEVSKLTGATPRAIRLYEDLGLIPVPDRKGKYRYYDERDVDLVAIIREAQQLGFTLAEIKALSHQATGCEDFPWAMAAGMVKGKIMDMDREIQRMKERMARLNDLMANLEKRACQR